MIRLLRIVGQHALHRFAQIGSATLMLFSALGSLPGRADFPLFISQMYVIGVKSLVLIVLSAFSIGAVLALQFYTQLVRFGAETTVGVGVAMVLLRELGPVVTALLFAGRAGSAITAEIGLMGATDQLSSMEMMGVDPLKRIVAPRLWAGFVCMPMLALIFSAIGIWSSALVGVDWLGIESVGFWAGMLDTVEIWEDIGKGTVKAVVFGMIVTWIAVFQGYDAEPTSEGISSATTRTVIFSSVAVLTLDFFLTLVMYGDF